MAESPARPFVSVVIPTRDRPRTLRTALRSALEQVGVDLEVIVVDDGSSKPAEPDFDPRIRVIRHESPRGVACARNSGLAVARGRWIGFLDDDDIWAPGKVRAQLKAAAAAEAAFVYAGAVLFDARRQGVLRFERPPEPDTFAALVRANSAVPAGASNILVMSDLVDEVGGFDPNFAHLADWDLWLRLALRARPAACDQFVVGYRQQSVSLRNSSGGVLRELRAMGRKHRGVVALRGEAGFATYRWLAEANVSRRRRLRASASLAIGAVRCGLPGELARFPRPFIRRQSPELAAPLSAVAWLKAALEREERGG